MVQITNGVTTLRVTNGAFKSLYEPCGFYPVGAAREENVSGKGSTQPLPESPRSDGFLQAAFDENDEECEEEEGEEDLSEIPLSEMSFYQLNAYADQLELDHDGIRSKKELRALIRNHLKG